MDIYDGLIQALLQTLEDSNLQKITVQNDCWKIEDKNIFLMDKDTQTELGGYPKESINILIQSHNNFLDGAFIIGDASLLQSGGHVSFGKIVILKTKDATNDGIYDFTQRVLLTDSKCYFKDVMTRASSKHYFINYKVSKSAIKNGITLSALANTIRAEFLKLPEVEACAVVLVIGESPIYKQLLPVAEKNKEITVALNHMFDGISMDCGHCDMNAICDEVQGLRAIHKKQIQKEG